MTPLTFRYIIRIGCTDWVFFSFNIVGLSSPLLPCRLVDLSRGLLYSENLQHPPSLSSHSTTSYSDCTSAPDSPFDRLERSSRPTSPLISCLSRQYLGLYLSPTSPTLLPASDIPDRCTIGGLLHDYRNPPTDYFRIFPTIRSILRP